MLLTDPHYHFPEVVPLQWIKTLSTGANRPIVVKAVDLGTKEAGEYVVKYRGGERMDASACGRELLGAWLADALGIAVPAPAVAQIRREFTDTLPGELRVLLSLKSLGINYSSRYIQGTVPVLYGAALDRTLTRQSARIFAFDQMLRNADRNAAKPNVFVADDQLYAIDHEISFGFLFTLPSLIGPNAWELNSIDRESAKNHLFYPNLKKHTGVDWDDVLKPFVNFPGGFWEKAWELMPPDWCTGEDFGKIQKHVTDTTNNVTKFQTELWNLLQA